MATGWDGHAWFICMYVYMYMTRIQAFGVIFGICFFFSSRRWALGEVFFFFVLLRNEEGGEKEEKTIVFVSSSAYIQRTQ